MFSVIVLISMLAAPFDPPLPKEIPEDDKPGCGCLHWRQVDGGYVCDRPACPTTPPKHRGRR